MLIRRTAIWLLTLGALVSMAGRAVAQPAHSGVPYATPTPSYENGSAPFAEDGSGTGHGIIEPFHPVGFEPEFDWFAPAQTSSYGRGQKANIGFFFSFERLYWSLAAPEMAYVGSEGPFPPSVFGSPFPNGPGIDNRFLGASAAWGNRWELGYIDTDDYGWLVSVLDHISQGQYRVDQTPAFFFGDPGGALTGSIDGLFPLGELPYVFDEFRMKNLLQMNGVEISRFYRARRLHNGAYFELLYGVRWLQINDTFWVIGDGNGTNREGIFDETFSSNMLDASQWSMRALNNLVGPQIGVRFFHERQRWVTSLSARFLAAANFQNLHLKANFGSNIGANLSGTTIFTNFRGLGVDTHMYTTTFSPVGELRVDVAYNVTKSVGLKVGYTGMVVGNISRASNSINYDALNLVGINLNDNQIFFANGLTFGVEINR